MAAGIPEPNENPASNPSSLAAALLETILGYWPFWSSQKGRPQLCELLLQLLRIILLACSRLIGLDQKLALLLTSQTI
ncbi:hypothetical protein HaLaN_31327 [Haematococcus lacustris]|uniref:Uncharacterized protein n=1 Tax=Haematococcus lacustris TaxID=44745 RepID=A0A6A0AHW3_HAELA|nr:hypothetical protein HaLaN_31327 [Haematococcus lacustris]